MSKKELCTYQGKQAKEKMTNCKISESCKRSTGDIQD